VFRWLQTLARPSVGRNKKRLSSDQGTRLHVPMFMDDKARPHRARIVQHFLQQEAVQTIPWSAMSADMNPIEHVWDFIGRKINVYPPRLF
jgi:hypothetical protein